MTAFPGDDGPRLLLQPDASRVVLRPFIPADNPFPSDAVPRTRIVHVVRRVLGLDAATVAADLGELRRHLRERHADVDALLSQRFQDIVPPDAGLGAITTEQRLLTGGYLLNEYAVEAAALFNPSMAAHPDQSGVPDGSLRVVMALRAVGEGHISSIVFRVGLVDAAGRVTIGSAGKKMVSPKVAWVAGRTPDDPGVRLVFEPGTDLAAMVLFPIGYQHRHGLEDLRLTRFVEDDGSVTYLGPYTGVGQEMVRQELLKTSDFETFALTALEGRYAATKGMALFPRRLNGAYAMLGRQDHENIWLLTSNDLHRWESGAAVIHPRWPWEFVQIGNCGPPIEIDQGWLVITHGVGAIRTYCLGACLLDKRDPTKLIARTRLPIVTPTDSTRDGYVPNAVYSCGAVVHAGRLILPYGVADSYTTLMTMPLDDLLARMD
ncbi:glycoside hydrolase family 130 protein [Sphingomonas qilianensis]|uniref:Glycoside hydrolase family 130 protein n=1 Tax=Sphingomonas qilianensis TaxID=1736690 RepID=A0ABU9XSS7_9SPHN